MNGRIANHIANRALMAVAIIWVTGGGFVSPAVSGQWRDTFDGPTLKGWRDISEKENADWEATWWLEDGSLNGKVELDNAADKKVDFLQWTVRQINAAQLTVAVKASVFDPFDGLDPALIAIFIGKRFPAGHPDYAEGYMFGPDTVESIRFNIRGDFVQPVDKALYQTRKRWRCFLMRAGSVSSLRMSC